MSFDYLAIHQLCYIMDIELYQFMSKIDVYSDRILELSCYNLIWADWFGDL